MRFEERRKHPRIAAAYNITFECFQHNVKVGEGVARTVDISESGVLVELPCAIALDASLVLSINAPFYLLVMRGDVVHSRQIAYGVYHVGVKLVDAIEGNWDHLKLDARTRLAEQMRDE